MNPHTMRAVVHDRYGPPEVLRVEDVERPVPKDDEVLVRIHATTVNQTDCHIRRARPFLWRFYAGLLRPRKRVLGMELAGEVEAVGAAVTEFAVGDRVFGVSDFGANAEFVSVRESAPLAHMPAGMTFEEAAAVCDGAIQALAHLRRANVGRGTRIVVYGASGSCGTAAVQLAKHFGAHVTAVCNTKNVELVRSLGADDVVDYTQEDFTKNGQMYDVVLDAVGKYSFRRCRRSLRPGGLFVATDRFHNLILGLWTSRIGDRKVVFALPRHTKKDVLFLKELIEAGKYRAVIDRTYPLEDVVQATKYVETWQKTGNVVLTLNGRSSAMKAAVRERFGSPDVVEIREIEMPAPADDEVLVRIRTASLNMADWYDVAGRPYVGRIAMGLRKPKSERLGVDYAGVVEAVGKDVTQFRPGDEVFGGRNGAFAEYVVAKADRAIVPKPANVTFEEAAAVPIAALTALQGLRDKGGLQAGQKVLVNGASGGVGTFAVLIAKALGAEVTAACSTRNVDQARALGADRVIDYTREDFTRSDERYDLLLDVAGSRSWSACKRVLTPKAIVVVVGGPKKNRLLGPLGHVVKFRLAAVASSRKVVFFIAKFNKPDMEVLRDLLESGKVTPVIDRRYDFSEIADALRYMGEGHARAKIVLTV